MTSRNNLAYAYWSAGRLQEAIALLEHTLTARETILGAEHPDTLTSRDNLAGLDFSTWRHKEAIALLKRNVLDCERILGADHPDTLTTRNNLAATYQSAGLVEQAFPLFEGNVLTQSEFSARITLIPCVHASTSPPRISQLVALKRRSRCLSAP